MKVGVVYEGSAVIHPDMPRAAFPPRFMASAPSTDVSSTSVDASGHSSHTARPFTVTSTLNRPEDIYSLLQTQKPSQRHLVDASRFWAVLIGIDAYPNSSLKGCVSDAILMEMFLHEHLGVPKGRIESLLSSDDPNLTGKTLPPSRDNIIRKLHSLIDNANINEGENIIIYFAGHGASYQCAHRRDSPSCKGELCGIEAICPVDRNDAADSGPTIPDISDREFNSILTQISQAKGPNITVILDCCYSAGATRDAEEGVRAAPELKRSLLEKALKAADESMRRFPSYVSVSDGNWFFDMKSHVVVAACAEYEKAKETSGPDGEGYNGCFTRALIRTLISNWTNELTYNDLIEHITKDLEGQGNYQGPVVAGERRKERVWFSK
ncbi:caspase domain-containing protein [Desarmillaria tabescens]|uniref:Caspase domain-containing protein n=1 Tax=Armillaria tabescens TaxID=1929756 RepID=A0AA39JNI9_ARMTA|nr:caspase domain-containing protein [Desarmillaria tabescens]KAK0444579.1 caspase domain-containing protein [Desarmillaria tabescens]